jgi:hypothetical protein
LWRTSTFEQTTKRGGRSVTSKNEIRSAQIFLKVLFVFSRFFSHMAQATRPTLRTALALYNTGAEAQFTPASQRPVICNVLAAVLDGGGTLSLNIGPGAVLSYQQARGAAAPRETDEQDTVLLQPAGGAAVQIPAAGEIEVASNGRVVVRTEYDLSTLVDEEAAALQIGDTQTFRVDVPLFGRLEEDGGSAAGLPTGKLTLFVELSADKRVRVISALITCAWRGDITYADRPQKVSPDFLELAPPVVSEPQQPAVPPQASLGGLIDGVKSMLPPEHFLAFFTPTSDLVTQNKTTRPLISLGHATAFFTAPAVMRFAGGQAALNDPDVLDALLRKSGAGALADALREVASKKKLPRVCIADLLLGVSGQSLPVFGAKKLVELFLTADSDTPSDTHTDLMMAYANALRANADSASAPGSEHDADVSMFALLTYIFPGWHRNTYVPLFLKELGFQNFDTGMLDEQGNPNLTALGYGLAVAPPELLRVLIRRDLFEAGSANVMFASVWPVTSIAPGVAISYGGCLSIRREGESPLTFCYGAVRTGAPSNFCMISLDPRTRMGGLVCGYGTPPANEQALARKMQRVFDSMLPDGSAVELAPLPPMYTAMNEHRRYVEEALKSASVFERPNATLQQDVMREEFVPVFGDGPALRVGFGPTAPGMQTRHTLTLKDSTKYNLVWLQRGGTGHGDWYTVDPLTRRLRRVRIEKLEGGGMSVTVIEHDNTLYCHRSFKARLAALWEKMSHHYHERMRHMADRIGSGLDDDGYPLAPADDRDPARPLGLMAMLTDSSKTFEAMDGAPAHTVNWPRDVIHNKNALIMYQIYGARAAPSTATRAPHITAHMTYI